MGIYFISMHCGSMENELTPRFGVSDFLAVVNQSLEMAFGAVEVEGEISSYKINHGKYVFFDLKDDTGSVGCFMTVWQVRTPLEDGMRVIIRAVPKVTDWGKFSLTVSAVKPVGEGSLKKSFELLKLKLEKEGLFDVTRKRSLPVMPRRVGVISSTGAAGYADFIKIANDRFGGVHFMVANVQVQGSVAADQIIRAISYFNELSEPPEVLVVIRGGGSADDLAVFNYEPLVRAIAASRIPTLTGIGHEIDESLCDLASDVRAATPSNAAQLLLPDKHVVIDNLRGSLSRAAEVYGNAVELAVERPKKLLEGAIDSWQLQLQKSLDGLRSVRLLLHELNPEEVLRRGYAIVAGMRRVGAQLQILTKDEKIIAKVESYEQR